MQLKAKYVKLSGVDLKPAFTVSEVLEKLIWQPMHQELSQ